MPGRHFQHCGEKEGGRVAVRSLWVRELRHPHPLAAFLPSLCLHSITKSLLLYLLLQRQSYNSGRRHHLAFLPFPHTVHRALLWVLRVATLLVMWLPPHQVSTWPAVSTNISFHLPPLNQLPPDFLLIPTSSQSQQNNWEGRCIYFYCPFIILNGRSTSYACFPPGRAFTLLELVSSC